MNANRFSLLLATTAIVMVLGGPGHNAFAGPTTDADISAAVPMPESAGLAPPTVDDLATVTEPPTGASSPIPSFPADRAAPAAAAPEIAAPAVVAPKSATLTPPAPVSVMPIEAVPACRAGSRRRGCPGRNARAGRRSAARRAAHRRSEDRPEDPGADRHQG